MSAPNNKQINQLAKILNAARDLEDKAKHPADTTDYTPTQKHNHYKHIENDRRNIINNTLELFTDLAVAQDNHEFFARIVDTLRAYQTQENSEKPTKTTTEATTND